MTIHDSMKEINVKINKNNIYNLLYMIVITILTVYCESLLSLWLSMFCCGAVMTGPYVGLELW